ncbi:Uncharacterized protein C9E9.04 [Wickerhamiella sorbophila]|uniref:Endoplasmic reticulum transmembrane protein n=1 Tax=Wickerhamiella sorbophila TaxID=45607 RepID=A0A2T0FL05_9ASCO|nr:Uncharacterized protein C9E9.04 [Wickerhamiella sorbophila]PRT55674.1 Uncharacterized protein C9E9.04 [Wickerhamiella sorbophila]
MTLYYSIVFALLVAEMLAFLLLVAPVPTKFRHSVVHALSSNVLVSKMAIGLKFTFVFILVLFIDSVNRVWRVQEEIERSRLNAIAQSFQGDRGDILARKFYAQRNMYLCGFTLFLSLILNRTYSLVEKLSLKEQEVKPSGSSSDEVAKLKKQLADKERDYDILKKQSEALTNEYNRVSDELNGKGTTDKKNA